jgi:hypothetical protein
MNKEYEAALLGIDKIDKVITIELLYSSGGFVGA